MATQLLCVAEVEPLPLAALFGPCPPGSSAPGCTPYSGAGGARGRRAEGWLGIAEALAAAGAAPWSAPHGSTRSTCAHPHPHSRLLGPSLRPLCAQGVHAVLARTQNSSLAP